MKYKIYINAISPHKYLKTNHIMIAIQSFLVKVESEYGFSRLWNNLNLLPSKFEALQRIFKVLVRHIKQWKGAPFRLLTLTLWPSNTFETLKCHEDDIQNTQWVLKTKITIYISRSCLLWHETCFNNILPLLTCFLFHMNFS